MGNFINSFMSQKLILTKNIKASGRSIIKLNCARKANVAPFAAQMAWR